MNILLGVLQMYCWRRGGVDYMVYSYDGNRVTEIDNEPDGTDFYGRTGYPAATGSYSWDAAGRMTADSSRGLQKIDYDHRNLPTLIRHSNGTLESHTYTASGLLRAITTVRRNGQVTRRVYEGDRVFDGDPAPLPLQYSYFNGGYFDGSGGVHYLHNDHQGSVVMVTDSAGMVEQRTSYYPYGEPHRNPAGQPILYGGKERLASTDDYNFDARRYHAAALFMATPDPSASSFHAISPYSYCGANPIMNIDLTGRKFTAGSEVFITAFAHATYKRLLDMNDEIMLSLTNILTDNVEAGQIDTQFANLCNAMNMRDEALAAIKELDVLRNSDLMYDVSFNHSVNDVSGSETTFKSWAGYNPRTNIFEIKLGAVDLGFISHELKHAYQFETGRISYSRNKNGLPYYDKSDEREAYRRERLFNRFAFDKLPGIYDALQDGPCGIPKENINDPIWLQNFADESQSAFRCCGKTYVSKKFFE